MRVPVPVPVRAGVRLGVIVPVHLVFGVPDRPPPALRHLADCAPGLA